MKLEMQVCSLQKAKRLKNLGVKQDSLFYWTADSSKGYYLRIGERTCEDDYSAFTVAELGEMIPDDGEGAYMYYTAKDQGKGKDGEITGFSCWQYDSPTDSVIKCPYLVFPTEAEARAALLLHLLESNLTSIEEVNQRLTKI